MPGTGIFQSTFSVADQVVGTPESPVTPARAGPRQPGQFSARALAVNIHAARNRVEIPAITGIGIMDSDCRE